LVKFPVALSGGSNVNSAPLAGARLSTRPVILRLRKLWWRAPGPPSRLIVGHLHVAQIA
jgi:hypothetical protein